jgi:hypothetical protein
MRAGLKNHAQPERFSWFGAVRTEHWLPSLLDRQAGSQRCPACLVLRSWVCKRRCRVFALVRGGAGLRACGCPFWAGCARALRGDNSGAQFDGCFCFFGQRLFFAGELGGELGGGFRVVHHAHLVPLEEFPHASAGAPPEVELKQERSDEREVELEGDARRALGQPVAAPHEAFHPAEKYSTFSALVLARSDADLFVSLRGFN